MYQDADGKKVGVPLGKGREVRRSAKNIVSWILICSGVLIVCASSGQQLNVPDRKYIPKEWKSAGSAISEAIKGAMVATGKTIVLMPGKM
jgi:hypothetical protein